MGIKSFWCQYSEYVSMYILNNNKNKPNKKKKRKTNTKLQLLEERVANYLYRCNHKSFCLAGYPSDVYSSPGMWVWYY